jgi:hypothetical protein
MGNLLNSYVNTNYTEPTEDIYAHFSFGSKVYKLKVSPDKLFDYLEKIITGETMVSINQLNDMLVSTDDKLLSLVVSKSCSFCQNKSRIKRTKTTLSVSDEIVSKSCLVTTQHESLVMKCNAFNADTSWEVCYVSMSEE